MVNIKCFTWQLRYWLDFWTCRSFLWILICNLIDCNQNGNASIVSFICLIKFQLLACKFSDSLYLCFHALFCGISFLKDNLLLFLVEEFFSNVDFFNFLRATFLIIIPFFLLWLQDFYTCFVSSLKLDYFLTLIP